MSSRFLAQQELLASSAATPSEQFIANARIAAYRARRGEIDKAKAIIALVRGQPREVLGAPLLSLVNIAEGLILLKSGDAQSAVEKWLRSRAISLSCSHAEGV
ncbi:MAG: hypothetical protein AB7U92_05780, partial [Piscinibacter sp.]|uniref:hypothetical protein n=1 Tax=Piscinibacter sp. TaxID=1903157 RepID=UPI003D120633